MKKEKIVTIVEARLGSRRLPGKTLMDVHGKTLLERVIDRLRGSRTSEHLVVATSIHPGDDPIEHLCRQLGVDVFRGSEEDVLDRVYRAAQKAKATVVVQAGADCPFYDPELVDLLVQTLCWGGYDYAANDMELTFPEGVDAHIIRYDALKVSAENACAHDEREDTPRFIWNHPETFSIFSLKAVPGKAMSRPELRLTVDYAQDLELCRKIYAHFQNEKFSTRDLIALLDQNPQWLKINEMCEQQVGAYIKKEKSGL